MYAVLDHGSSSKYKISLFRRPNSFGSCVTYLSCEVFCTEFDFSLASPAVGMVLASHDFLHKQETEELTTSRWRNRRKNRLFTPGTRLKRLVQHVYFRSDPCVFGQRIRDRLFLANQNLRKIQNQNVPDWKASVPSSAWQKDVSHQVPCYFPTFLMFCRAKGRLAKTLLWVSRFHDRPTSRSRELATDFSRFLEK